MIRLSKSLVIAAVALFVLLSVLGATFRQSIEQRAFLGQSKFEPQATESLAAVNNKLHLLLPASDGAIDLCKTILTGAILGYPTPTLIAWNETFDQDRLLGGGSHIAKISGVLRYLESLDASQDHDLVLMMDAFDIWFQLPPEFLVSRYHAINAKANERLSTRLGKAFAVGNINQTIIFGAGKRCAPNQMHTIACYPIPDSPVPDDVYGANTDTVMGRNKYTSLKQRYLNSGYVIGPAEDMRKMFRRAWEKVEAHQDQDPNDNGSHGSDFMYHGSDQSIFNIILGEQEFQREVMRRRHLNLFDKFLGRGKPIPHVLESTIVKDPLNPDFTHESMLQKDGRPDDFGTGLDYFSNLGHQAVNTDQDTRYLLYGKDIPEQLKDRNELFDCSPRVSADLPDDILATVPPLGDETMFWTALPLFTNLCLGTVPVMIHHNGDKGARAWQWPMSWMQSHARLLMGEVLSEGRGGALLPTGGSLSWEELCPAKYEWELFRDVDKPEDLV